ncbi:helix-turn-helix domain-containing protein [Limibacter armeniacum]|uniref:helix-turn-helix domain-containing protein n=1 Tax=Limibacter armeniacum TaxID=466084 RepID=UPI002FE51EB1
MTGSINTHNTNKQVIREENIRLILGLKVRMKRQELQMSLSELAKKADMSVSYLNEIEKGKKYPKRSKILALSGALGVSYDQLVSLKISKKLGALSDLLTSDILHELPLDVFGIEPRNLIELMSDAPAKLSAFVNTIVEISRNYALTVESLYFSVLRSYQEMHDNYFEEIERLADSFREEFLSGERSKGEVLREYLQKECGYAIDEEKLGQEEVLNSFRSVLKEEGGKKLLLVNKNLNERQRCFIFTREIAYHLMELEERSNTYSWLKVASFDVLLNDYKATYFAGAVALPEAMLVEDLNEILNADEFRAETFVEKMRFRKASPETYIHRLTSMLPKNFELNKLFFLRLDHMPGENQYLLTKELHLDGLHSPHGTVLSEHYCRRWVSLKVFQQLEEHLAQGGDSNAVVCSAQISRYITSGKEYFCISIARPTPSPSTEKTHTSITIGFLMNDAFKQRFKFWRSEKLKVEFVNETCERCPASDCSVRAAKPSVLERQKKETELNKALTSLMAE